MKPETLIYHKVKNMIPDNSEKNIFFAAIGKTSYEVFFYSFFDNKPIQCFTLAEQDLLDGNELDAIFEEIVNIIKASKIYDENKLNIATIVLDKTGVRMTIDYHEKNARLYKIKKDWIRSITQS